MLRTLAFVVATVVGNFGIGRVVYSCSVVRMTDGDLSRLLVPGGVVDRTLAYRSCGYDAPRRQPGEEEPSDT